MSTDNLDGKKVLLIDDDIDFLKLTIRTFNKTGVLVYVTTNSIDALDKLFVFQPDLVLLNTGMAGIGGFKLCRKIKEISKTPLIMLSALGHDEIMLKGLEAGADDFLSKPIKPEILLARARAVMRRGELNNRHPEAGGYNDGCLEIDTQSHRVLVRGKPVKLTPVEFRMLAYLMGNAGRVISYDQILFGVWTENHKGKYGNVHVYISYLRNKIEENPKKPSYIRSVPRVGYIFEKKGKAHGEKLPSKSKDTSL
jgi:two-component system, OmpR family, alkaline phosphatase synthesis response regulator PhoP